MTSEIKAYVPGWVVEKLFDNTDYGVNIRYYQIVGGLNGYVYDKHKAYNYSLIIRHAEGTSAANLFDEAVDQLKNQHLYPEPKTNEKMKTVNKQAYEKRIDETVEQCSTTIQASWDEGKPKLTLEVDTDIYSKVKEKLFQEFTELSFARIGVTEGYTSNTKKGTTKFAVTNKNYA